MPTSRYIVVAAVKCSLRILPLPPRCQSYRGALSS